MINEIYAQAYCKDDISKIENYDEATADTTQTWELHHRLELTLDGEYAHSREELKRLGMYYHRPYFELIFMTASEHARLHAKYISDETRQKMSESKKGENNPFYGKHHSDETRQKISETMKGRPLTKETRKKLSEAVKRRWNGMTNFNS